MKKKLFKYLWSLFLCNCLVLLCKAENKTQNYTVLEGKNAISFVDGLIKDNERQLKSLEDKAVYVKFFTQHFDKNNKLFYERKKCEYWHSFGTSERRLTLPENVTYKVSGSSVSHKGYEDYQIDKDDYLYSNIYTFYNSKYKDTKWAKGQIHIFDLDDINNNSRDIADFLRGGYKGTLFYALSNSGGTFWNYYKYFKEHSKSKDQFKIKVKEFNNIVEIKYGIDSVVHSLTYEKIKDKQIVKSYIVFYKKNEKEMKMIVDSYKTLGQGKDKIIWPTKITETESKKNKLLSRDVIKIETVELIRKDTDFFKIKLPENVMVGDRRTGLKYFTGYKPHKIMKKIKEDLVKEGVIKNGKKEQNKE